MDEDEDDLAVDMQHVDNHLVDSGLCDGALMNDVIRTASTPDESHSITSPIS